MAGANHSPTDRGRWTDDGLYYEYSKAANPKAAGLITGITETATGIGGPPLALVYQHQPGPTLRATLAACFLIGQLASLVLLALTGRLPTAQLTAAADLLPALAAGTLATGWLYGRLNGRPLRLAMLLFTLISGLICLV